MSQGFNQILLLGNLAREPELRRTGNGAAVCVFRLAVDDVRRPHPGAEPVTEKLYVDVMTTGRLAETCHAALVQGSRAFVQGRLQQQEWTTRDGQRRSQIRVVASTVQFLDPVGPPADRSAPEGGSAPAPDGSADGDTFSLK